MNAFLYITTVLIWGTTWIAIYWQSGDVPALVSVFYRFVIAAVLFLPILALIGKLQKTHWRDHRFFAMQGLCLFSLNFICFYTASHYVISGLIAVVFSMATLFNGLNQWLFWRVKPTLRIYISGVCGLLGLVLLFWDQLSLAGNSHDILYGFLFAAAGTYCFSLGNMISMRNSREGIQPWTSNAYGMVYGVVILWCIVQFSNAPFVIDSRPIYIASLLYLAIPGSIIGFTTYLTLVARIGASQAAYTTVLFPVVALVISTFAEGYQWGFMAVSGLVLVLVGVLVSFVSFDDLQNLWKNRIRHRCLLG